MKTLALVALALTAGCTEVNTRWTDGTPLAVYVRSGGTIESAQRFTDRMQRDMQLWNDALVARGCAAPFRYVNNLYDAVARIELVNRAQWPSGAVGEWTPDKILILSEANGTLDTYVDDPTWIVALHELGHALGLEHSVHTDSVMQTGTVKPIEPLPLSAGDVDDAAVAIGCR